MKVEKIKETQYFKELYQSEIPDDAYAVMTDYEEDGICREEDLPVFGSDVTFSGKEGAETFKQVAEELNEQYADGWQVLSALVDPNYNGDTLALYVANELKDLARDNQHQSQSRKEIMGRLNQFFKLAAQDLQGLVSFTDDSVD